MRTTDFWRRGALAAGLGVLLGRSLPAPAQALAGAAPDSAAWAGARAGYAAALGTEAVLYDGPEYVDYTNPGTVGHQFFLGPELRPGQVTYRGGHFGPVPLRYDLARDQLVLRLPAGANEIALVSDEVVGFELAGHRFTRVSGDSLLATGFYEVLAEGPVRLLARHRKQSERATTGQGVGQQYRQLDELLLRTPATVAEVGSLKRLAELLPDHQDEVLRYSRQQRLRFSSAERAASAAQALRYYYSLRP